MPHYDEARGLVNNVVAQNATLVATATNAAPSKATPVDAAAIPIIDSATAFSLKKLTWANLKATLATWLNAELIPGTFTAVFATFSAGLRLTSNVGRLYYSGATILDSEASATILLRTGGSTRVQINATDTTNFTPFVSKTLKPTDAAGYLSSDGSAGYTGTVTSASLVGKTITIKDGIITGFA
jgi:hypothetical protein